MIVGGYTLHLYCDGEPCKGGPSITLEHQYSFQFADFAGHNEADTKQQARKAGWRFSNCKVYCPACNAVTGARLIRS